MVLFQPPAFVLKIKLGNGLKEAGKKSRSWVWDLSLVEADSLEKHPASCSWHLPRVIRTADKYPTTGRRQADIRTLEIQMRVWAARSKVSGKDQGQMRSEAMEKGDRHTGKEQEWGLLLNQVTSEGFLGQEQEAQRLQVINKGLPPLRRKVGWAASRTARRK